MTSLTGTPYGQTEAGAAYDQAAALLNDEFDTSGADPSFCELCEHSPCVAGGYKFCRMDPRFITAEHYVRTTIEAARKVQPSPLSTPFELAVNALARTAWVRDFAGEQAMRDLVKIRSRVRKAVRS